MQIKEVRYLVSSHAMSTANVFVAIDIVNICNHAVVVIAEAMPHVHARVGALEQSEAQATIDNGFEDDFQ